MNFRNPVRRLSIKAVRSVAKKTKKLKNASAIFPLTQRKEDERGKIINPNVLKAALFVEEISLAFSTLFPSTKQSALKFQTFYGKSVKLEVI